MKTVKLSIVSPGEAGTTITIEVEGIVDEDNAEAEGAGLARLLTQVQAGMADYIEERD